LSIWQKNTYLDCNAPEEGLHTYPYVDTESRREKWSSDLSAAKLLFWRAMRMFSEIQFVPEHKKITDGDYKQIIFLQISGHSLKRLNCFVIVEIQLELHSHRFRVQTIVVFHFTKNFLVMEKTGFSYKHRTNTFWTFESAGPIFFN